MNAYSDNEMNGLWWFIKKRRRRKKKRLSKKKWKTFLFSCIWIPRLIHVVNMWRTFQKRNAINCFYFLFLCLDPRIFFSRYYLVLFSQKRKKWKFETHTVISLFVMCTSFRAICVLWSNMKCREYHSFCLVALLMR